MAKRASDENGNLERLQVNLDPKTRKALEVLAHDDIKGLPQYLVGLAIRAVRDNGGADKLVNRWLPAMRSDGRRQPSG